MKWEYELLILPSPHLGVPINKSDDFLDKINALGADGWEIVLLWPDGRHVLMKRQKGDAQ